MKEAIEAGKAFEGELAGVDGFLSSRLVEVGELADVLQPELLGIRRRRLFAAHLLLEYASVSLRRKYSTPALWMEVSGRVLDAHVPAPAEARKVLSLVRRALNSKVMQGLVRKYQHSAEDHLRCRLIV